MNSLIDQKEWNFAILVIVVILALTSVPYIYGYLFIPKNLWFSGFVINPIDQNTYYSWMIQGKSGYVLFRLLYTHERHKPVFFNPLFLVLGYSSRAFNLSLELVYQISRLLAGALLLFSAYYFISMVTSDCLQRKITFLILSFGSGLGWIYKLYQLLSGQYGELLHHHVLVAKLMFTPIDLWVPEANVFFSIFTMPHFSVSITLTILIFIFAILARQKRKFKYSIVAGIFTFLLAFIHSYHIITVYSVLLTYMISRAIKYRQIDFLEIINYLFIFMLSFPAVLYNYLMFTTHPAFIGWFSQNRQDSPNPIYYILGFGFVLFLSLPSFYEGSKKFRNKTDIENFLIIWVIVGFTLLYLPTNYQRRLSQGIQIPLSLLCSFSIFGFFLPRFKNCTIFRKMITVNNDRKFEQWVITLIIIAMLPTTLFHLLNGVRNIYRSDLRSDLFLKREAVLGMQWLSSHAKPDDVILSSFIIGNYIPRFTNCHVIIGHTALTPNYSKVSKEVSLFYSGNMSNDELISFLRRYKANYIFYSNYERKLGNFRPAGYPILRRCFSFHYPDNGQGTEIYKVEF